MLTWLYTVGFEHSSFVFAQEANIHENRFNDFRIPSGMLIVFLEKALTLIHMETHLDDVSNVLLLQSVEPPCDLICTYVFGWFDSLAAHYKFIVQRSKLKPPIIIIGKLNSWTDQTWFLLFLERRHQGVPLTIHPTHPTHLRCYCWAQLKHDSRSRP